MSTTKAQNDLLILSDRDNIGIARADLKAGEQVTAGQASFTLANDIPLGHKISLDVIEAGDKIIKCGISIGSATCQIPQGSQLHLHNVKSDYIPTYTRASETSH